MSEWKVPEDFWEDKPLDIIETDAGPHLYVFCSVIAKIIARGKVAKTNIEEPYFVRDPAGERKQNRHPDRISHEKTSFLEEPCFVLDPAGERLQNRHPDQISPVKTSFLEEMEPSQRDNTLKQEKAIAQMETPRDVVKFMKTFNTEILAEFFMKACTIDAGDLVIDK